MCAHSCKKNACARKYREDLHARAIVQTFCVWVQIFRAHATIQKFVVNGSTKKQNVTRVLWLELYRRGVCLIRKNCDGSTAKFEGWKSATITMSLGEAAKKRSSCLMDSMLPKLNVKIKVESLGTRSTWSKNPKRHLYCSAFVLQRVRCSDSLLLAELIPRVHSIKQLSRHQDTSSQQKWQSEQQNQEIYQLQQIWKHGQWDRWFPKSTIHLDVRGFCMLNCLKQHTVLKLKSQRSFDLSVKQGEDGQDNNSFTQFCVCMHLQNLFACACNFECLVRVHAQICTFRDSPRPYRWFWRLFSWDIGHFHFLL